MRGSRAVCAFLLVALLAASPALADAELEQKLRDQLKTTTLGLRDEQDQNAGLTAKVTELTKKLADAEKELADLKAQAQAAQGAPSAGDDVQSLQESLRQTQDQLAQSQEVLKKWQAAYTKAADVARARDAAAVQAEGQLKRTGATLETNLKKNAALVTLANELLDKIQNHSLLDDIAETEPVTQLYRVKLENIIQDYQDRVADQEMPRTNPVKPENP